MNYFPSANRLKLLALGALLLLCGCAGQAPEPPALYSLGLAPVAHSKITAVKVELPAYLDRNVLVVQTGPNTLHRARQHRWAEPLAEGITRRLQPALGRTALDSVAVQVATFHGNLEGEVFLDASWQAESRCGGARDHFSAAGQQNTDGYESMVSALGNLLDQLAQHLAQRMQADCEERIEEQSAQQEKEQAG